MKKCQKFTPTSHVELLLDAIDYSGRNVIRKTFLENSCGEGNVLKVAVERYVKAALDEGMSKRQLAIELEKYFIAFEIDKHVADVCSKNLNGVLEKYNIPPVDWNIINGDYLKEVIKEEVSFISGNPPFIMYQDLENEDRKFLKNNFESCRDGKFDYCYAFIEKSIKDLGHSGKMSYLIPNSLFKNSFGSNLRDIMREHLESILDFPYTTVFEDALTSPAIISIVKDSSSETVDYINNDSNTQLVIPKTYLVGKWIFSNDFANVVALRGTDLMRFGDFFQVSNSVATLANKVFVLNDYERIFGYYTVGDYKIEDTIVRRAASPRKMARSISEYILFPYEYDDLNYQRYQEKQFNQYFPEAARYLQSKIEILDNRKADGAWYEYGRSQALGKVNQPKLLMSSIITGKVNIYTLDQDVIPYSGFFIVPKAELTLERARKILESENFFNYIVKNSINANGYSVRCSVKDIMNFPVDGLI